MKDGSLTGSVQSWRDNTENDPEQKIINVEQSIDKNKDSSLLQDGLFWQKLLAKSILYNRRINTKLNWDFSTLNIAASNYCWRLKGVCWARCSCSLTFPSTPQSRMSAPLQAHRNSRQLMALQSKANRWPKEQPRFSSCSAENGLRMLYHLWARRVKEVTWSEQEKNQLCFNMNDPWNTQAALMRSETARLEERPIPQHQGAN